ncbi:MAG TPA: hypothetical protein VN328_11545 [Thermodesulfovibrionales bacterium]|nr:hypothetical protein [Thermodesulfovibrionales bacterium]
MRISRKAQFSLLLVPAPKHVIEELEIQLPQAFGAYTVGEHRIGMFLTDIFPMALIVTGLSAPGA